MKKYTANIITSCRIVLSLPLLFIPLSSAWCYVIYLVAGFTDMADGMIARKTDTVSEFGTSLDTVADFVFLAISLSKFLPILELSIWLWIWIAIIALIKITNIIIASKQPGGIIISNYSIHFSLTGGTKKVADILAGALGGAFQPEADENCDGCCLCAEKCPAGAIDPENLRTVDKDKCIRCMRCIAVCHRQAGAVNAQVVAAVAQRLEPLLGGHKKNYLYL